MCRLILLCAVSLDPRPLIQEDLSPATAFIQEIKSRHCCSRVSGLRGRVDGGAESGDNCYNCGKPHARVRAHHPRSREVSSFFCADSRWSRSRHFRGRMGRRWRWAAQAVGTSEPVIRGIQASGSSGSHQRGPWPEPPFCSQCMACGLPQSCPLEARSSELGHVVPENQRLHLARGLSGGHEQLRRG